MFGWYYCKYIISITWILTGGNGVEQMGIGLNWWGWGWFEQVGMGLKSETGWGWGGDWDSECGKGWGWGQHLSPCSSLVPSHINSVLSEFNFKWFDDIQLSISPMQESSFLLICSITANVRLSVSSIKFRIDDTQCNVIISSGVTDILIQFIVVRQIVRLGGLRIEITIIFSCYYFF